MAENINKLALEDKLITCIDCGVTFEFNTGEQRYYLAKGLSEPKRCPACRKARRDRIVTDSGGWQR